MTMDDKPHIWYAGVVVFLHVLKNMLNALLLQHDDMYLLDQKKSRYLYKST